MQGKLGAFQKGVQCSAAAACQTHDLTLEL